MEAGELTAIRQTPFSGRPSGEMADAQDLKSCVRLRTCGFESRLGY
jgi:hypothetical protein